MKIIREHRIVSGEMETTITLVRVSIVNEEYKIVISEGIADDYKWLYDDPPYQIKHEYIFRDFPTAITAFSQAVDAVEKGVQFVT